MNAKIALSTLSLTLILAACGTQPTTTATDTTGRATPDLSAYQAPLLGTDQKEPIPGQYIVVLNEGELQSNLSAQSAGGLISALNLDPAGVNVKYMYASALNGFAGKLSAQNLQKLRADPRVKYIEQDSVVRMNDTQSNATWGIDRADQRNLPLSGTYTYDTTASNVSAYVIDTGIRTTHQQFGGRAVWGTNQTGDGQNTDCNGHGTHVAGTVGGTTYGLAKGVKLVAVKVLGCDGSGSNSGVIAGINWAASNKGSGPAVANMSLGGSANQSLDDAMKGAISKGLTMVVAAGNETQDACKVSPARVSEAITVGSTDSADARSSFSNYGTCVDLFAPGSNITSAWKDSDTSTKSISGTSMASPHVAGAAALILAKNPTFTPAQVASALKANATPNKVTDAKTGSPNLLLYTAPGSTTPTPDPDPEPIPTPTPETYTGSLSSGYYTFKPSSTGITYNAGTITATLTGPSTGDFDLYLQKRNTDGTWSYVAKQATSASTEKLTYTASAGTYRWIVSSYYGSGSYTLTVNR